MPELGFIEMELEHYDPPGDEPDEDDDDDGGDWEEGDDEV